MSIKGLTDVIVHREGEPFMEKPILFAVLGIDAVAKVPPWLLLV